MTAEEAMREGAVKILADYDSPPDGGTLVPRAWVEANRPELEAWAEVERVMLGDLDGFKPTGLLNAIMNPAPVPGYVEIANADGIRWHERER